MNIKRNRRAFTIVELVIVIAVIAVLASVLVPTFSGVLEKAKQSKAMQEAKNAWNEVSYTYVAGYDGFAYAGDELNGWYYDYEDGIAKYTVDDQYTVTYDGENFVVNALDGSAWVWDEITEASTDFSDFSLSGDPFGLKLSYYTNIYTRGFSWATSPEVTDSKLYVVPSNLGENADFSGATVIDGTYDNSRSVITTHKAVVTGLSAGTIYSFKVGSDAGWKYGTFKTEQSNITSITAIQLSDAQTIEADKLYVWENTMAQAIETAGHNLDMILYNGDQFDSNMTGTAKQIDRSVRYSVAVDTVADYIQSIPYMASSGNHEPANSEKNIHVNNNAIEYGYDNDSSDGKSEQGGYYSYDYGFAHFIVLNTNDDLANQVTWIKDDLEEANNNSNIKWIIVMMHIGTYATGDHSNNNQIQNLIKTFTPIFSEYHVDLVLQAHDHTYNKTLPYSWDSLGYYNTTENTTENTKDGKTYQLTDVVNYNVQTTTYNGETYDLNPNGTYYVTTGAAGHRVGAREAKDGVKADVVKNKDGTLSPLASNFCYLNNTYKIEVGEIMYSNKYDSFSGYGNGDTKYPFKNDGVYDEGDPATGNVNAQMFGILNLTETTLTYDFYTVEGNEVNLFDSLNIMKTN